MKLFDTTESIACAYSYAARSPLHAQRSSGIALVMVLGILSVMTLMAVAFAISMRTERVAAGNYADSVRARQLVQVGLARALDDLAGKLGTNGLSFPGGTNYPSWAVTNSYNISYTNTSTNAHLLQLLALGSRENEATNFVPRALWADATNKDYIARSNHWLLVEHVEYTNDLAGGSPQPVATNILARVKYLILNCSGLLDANFAGGAARGIGTNPMEIAISNMPEIGNPATFINNRTDDVRYETLDELTKLNTALNGAPSNFTVYSHALPGYWDKFGIQGAVQQVNLAKTNAIYEQITNAFYQAGCTGSYEGVTVANILYSNLIDYVDGDSRPGNLLTCVEPVPMINEVVFRSAPDGLGAINTVEFELWYPFVGPIPTNKFYLNVSVSCGANPPITKKWGPFSISNQFWCSGAENVLTEPTKHDPYTFKIIDAEVLDKDNIPVDQLINPGANNFVVDLGKSKSLQCVDPRFNWDLIKQWRVYDLTNTLSLVNDAAIADYKAANAGVDFDSGNGMYVANWPLRSVGELGYLAYAPWRTIKLYGHNSKRVLDVFAVGTNASYAFVTNTIWRGRVNPNTRQKEVLSAVFSNMPLDEYPGQVVAPMSAVQLSDFVARIQTNAFYTNLSDIGWNLATNDLAFAGNELKRESIFRNTCGLLSVRQNLFTIIIEAQVASGGNFPRNPVRQRAAALVWRDPYTGEMFVRSIKWLKN